MKNAHADSLARALATMRFRVRDERYALAGLPDSNAPEIVQFIQSRADVTNPGVVNVVLEAGVLTVVAPEQAMTSLAALPGARIERGYRMITFETPMTWDVVGFLALATRELAAAGVPVGAVCGFDRDHLFIHEKHLDTARAALRAAVCAELL